MKGKDLMKCRMFSWSRKDERRCRLQSCFTLIELFIVISVIAILASLLLPALARARDKAHGITCLNKLKQISYAGAMYQSDNQDYFPPSYGGGSNFPGWGWVILTYEYYLVSYILKTGDSEAEIINTLLTNEFFACPKDTVVKDITNRAKRSYPINYYIGDRGGTSIPRPSLKASAIRKNPSSCVFVAERHYAQGYACSGYGMSVRPLTYAGVLPAYHQLNAGIAFADAHAELHSALDLITSAGEIIWEVE